MCMLSIAPRAYVHALSGQSERHAPAVPIRTPERSSRPGGRMRILLMQPRNIVILLNRGVAGELFVERETFLRPWKTKETEVRTVCIPTQASHFGVVMQ